MYLFYYLPLGTEVKLRHVPWVTLTLIALCTSVFLVFKYDPKGWVLVNAWALVPNQPSLLNAFMANFLHASWGHLIGNMLYLWLFGAPVEDRIGPVRMLISFLLCGAFSLMAQAWLTLTVMQHSQAVAILGASGAVSGITGLFLLRFYYVKVRVGIPALLLLRGVRRGSQLYLPALAVVVIWSGIQLGYAVMAVMQGQSGTAYGAHIAGLLLGLALGLGFGLRRGARAERVKVGAERCFRDCRWYEAQEAYSRLLVLEPANTDARLQLARAHMLTHQETGAAREYTQAVRDAMTQGREAATRDAYLEMRKVIPMHGLPLGIQRRVAELLEQSGYLFEAAEAWERYGRLEPMAPRAIPALFHAASLSHAHLGDTPRAQAIYRTVIFRFPESEAAGVARLRLEAIPQAESA